MLSDLTHCHIQHISNRFCKKNLNLTVRIKNVLEKNLNLPKKKKKVI